MSGLDGPRDEGGGAVVLLGLAATLFAVRAVASYGLPLYDDAFISFRYGRNLAQHGAFVFNEGARVLGTTSPLFALMTALPHLGGIPIVPASLVFNAACDVATLFITWHALRTTRGTLAAVWFAGAFAASPIAARIAVGGMEVNLFLLMSVAAIALYHAGRRTAAILVAATATMVRPEGLALVALLCGLDFRQRRTLRLAGVAALVLLAAALATYAYFGQVIPQSVIAKSRHLNSSPFVVLRAFLVADPVAAALLPAALWGAVRAGERDDFARTAALWGGVYLALYLLFRPHPWSWYGLIIHYTEFLLAGLGLADLVRRSARLRQLLRPARLAPGLAVTVVALWVGIVALRGPSGVKRHVYGPLQHWCSTQDLKGVSILAEDIGAVGYWCDAFIHDAYGLVWPEARRYAALDDAIAAQRPDYLFINVSRSDAVGRTARISGAYEPIRRFSPTGNGTLVPRPSEVTGGWRPDYILYRRTSRPPPGAPPPHEERDS